MKNDNDYHRPIISFTSDFGFDSEGVGIMKGTALRLCPWANVIDLTHGVDSFNVINGARQFETIYCLPVGYHVCVVDFGVGTARKPIIIRAKRGDYLIGPDNGVMIPAARRLGGIDEIVMIENRKYMLMPISTTFHGRDIFASAAAWLARDIPLKEFGRDIPLEALVPAAFEDARTTDGRIEAIILHINKFGNIFTNILVEQMASINVEYGCLVEVLFRGKKLKILYENTFGTLGIGEELIFADSYGRVALAINQGSFSKKHKVQIGSGITFAKWQTA